MLAFMKVMPSSQVIHKAMTVDSHWEQETQPLPRVTAQLTAVVSLILSLSVRLLPSRGEVVLQTLAG